MKCESMPEMTCRHIAMTVWSVASDGESNRLNITKEVAQYRLETANNLLNAMIDAGVKEDEAYAAVMEVMAANTNEFSRVAAEVAQKYSINMGNATASAAQAMSENSENMQVSLNNILKKAFDVAKGIHAMAKGETDGSTEIYGGGGFSQIFGIDTEAIGSSFKKATVDVGNTSVDFDGFQSQLELDIKGYTDAISNIDSQIEVLKNLQASFGSDINGGLGGHGYADRIKKLEKEKSAINNALKDKSGSSEFTEQIDHFKRRTEALNDVLSLLKSNIDNVSGSFAKNTLVDAELGVTEEKFNNYTDALAMYTQKANEALSKLPADIAAKVKDGSVALTDFIGDGTKGVVEAIKEYESWANEISDCKQELAGLQKEIRQLELEKFNNIIDSFNDQFNLRGNSKDLISKQIDLLKEAGELIGESFFNAQIDQSQKQLGLLEAEKAQLVEQMESAISSGRVQKGSAEWLSMIDSLNDVESNILDCKKSIEEFDNSILEIHTEVFNKIQDRFSDLNSELSNIIDLFDGMDVSDDKGTWSKEGIAQLGLLAQQYELAQHQVQQYNDEIAELKAQYAAGKYSATEYMDKLSQLSKEQWDAVNATEAAKDAILKLNEARVEAQIKGIEKEIEAYDELTQAQIDALKASKDLHDYEANIAEKSKAIADLEKQIAAMANDNSASTIAKRKKLEEQLVEAKKALEEEQYQHSIETQQEALNKQFEDYEKSRNDEIESLRESLNDKETIIADSFETVKNNADIIGQEIASIAVNHGITVSDALISSWESGETAIAGYGEVLSQGTSAFIGNIMDVENEMWNLQANANNTANTLAWMFSTKADNLVNELATSYYAEANLANMTNALQNSLINTLERGYNVSSIVNSLANVESAARNAKKALDDMNTSSPGNGYNSVGSGNNSKPASGSDMKSPFTYGDYSEDTGNTSNAINSDKSMKQYAVIDGQTGKVLDRIYKTHKPTTAEMQAMCKRYRVPAVKVQAYASGTRNSKGGLIIKDEDGYEMMLSNQGSGKYALANEGSQIFTKEETDNMDEWVKFDPDTFMELMGKKQTGNMSEWSKKSLHEMYSMEDTMRLWGHMINPTPLTTEFNKVNNNAVNIQSMLTVNGDVNDLKHLNEQMERIATKISDKSSAKAADNAIRKLAAGIRR